MQKRQRFTAEFKREAVRLFKAGDRPPAVIARELGIPRNRLYKWAQDLDTKGAGAFGGSGRPRKTGSGSLLRIGLQIARPMGGTRSGKALGLGFDHASERIPTQCALPLQVQPNLVDGGLRRALDGAEYVEIAPRAHDPRTAGFNAANPDCRASHPDARSRERG